MAEPRVRLLQRKTGLSPSARPHPPPPAPVIYYWLFQGDALNHAVEELRHARETVTAQVQVTEESIVMEMKTRLNPVTHRCVHVSDKQ